MLAFNDFEEIDTEIQMIVFHMLKLGIPAECLLINLTILH